MAKVRELCGLIHGVYDHESDFAEKLGWSRQKLNKITNGITEPNLNDVAEIAEGLGQPLNYIADIFLRYKSPNGQQVKTNGM